MLGESLWIVDNLEGIAGFLSLNTHFYKHKQHHHLFGCLRRLGPNSFVQIKLVPGGIHDFTIARAGYDKQKLLYDNFLSSSLNATLCFPGSILAILCNFHFIAGSSLACSHEIKFHLGSLALNDRRNSLSSSVMEE